MSFRYSTRTCLLICGFIGAPLFASAEPPKSRPADVIQVLQNCSDRYIYGTDTIKESLDLQALGRLRESSTNADARNLAKQKLQLELLKGVDRDVSKAASENIRNLIGETLSAEGLARSIALDVLKQRGAKDESFEQTLQRSFLAPFKDLRDAALQQQINVCMAALARLSVAQQFRGTAETALQEFTTDAIGKTSIKTEFQSDQDRKIASLTLSNVSKTTLHNCVIVVDVGYNKTLYQPADAGLELLAAGLMDHFGFDPSKDIMVSFLKRVCAIVDQGTIIFIPSWTPNKDIEFPLDSSARISSRAESANLTVSSDEFCFKNRSLPIQEFKDELRRIAAAERQQAIAKAQAAQLQERKRALNLQRRRANANAPY